MKKTILILLFTIILGAIVTKIMARSPAVEPIIGISIDEYPKGDPKKKRGFKFKRTSATNFEGKRIPADIKKHTNINTSDPAPIFLVTLMLMIPMAIVFVINRRSNTFETDDSKNSLNNTVELFPNDRDSNNFDDDDFKKAS